MIKPKKVLADRKDEKFDLIEVYYLPTREILTNIRGIAMDDKILDVYNEQMSRLSWLEDNEAISLLPPWIFNGNSVEEVFLHYVINENMHKNKHN